MSAALAAALVGVSAATARRWRACLRGDGVLCRSRGPGPGRDLSDGKRARLTEAVQELRGLCGASALARAVGVSRRQAARVKSEVMTQLERERIGGCARVLVPEPDVLRSLDQLYIGQRPAQRIALVASDAAVPYRTSARLLPSYTAGEVARLLAEDSERHGPPLAMRMDRAWQHDAAPVRELLDKHEVLMLHGPARYPQYYSQHERQNREHRAWLAHSEGVDDAELQEMLRVQRCASRLAERLAIEQALEDRGLVRRVAGGW